MLILLFLDLFYNYFSLKILISSQELITVEIVNSILLKVNFLPNQFLILNSVNSILC